MTMMWLDALGTMYLPITRAGEAPSAHHVLHLAELQHLAAHLGGPAGPQPMIARITAMPAYSATPWNSGGITAASAIYECP